MRDTVNLDIYAGVGSLVRYYVNRAATLARVTLLLPITSGLSSDLRRWTFTGEDPPIPIHDRWRTYASPNPLEIAIQDITFTKRDLRAYHTARAFVCGPSSFTV